jgi:hypothetical protein
VPGQQPLPGFSFVDEVAAGQVWVENGSSPQKQIGPQFAKLVQVGQDNTNANILFLRPGRTGQPMPDKPPEIGRVEHTQRAQVDQPSFDTVLSGQFQSRQGALLEAFAAWNTHPGLPEKMLAAGNLDRQVVISMRFHAVRCGWISASGLER